MREPEDLMFRRFASGDIVQVLTSLTRDNQELFDFFGMNFFSILLRATFCCRAATRMEYGIDAKS